MRDTLFGDLPLDLWPAEDDGDEEPWRTFATARRALAAGDRAAAVRAWCAVLEQPGLESRHAVQAWTFLRAHGVQPEPSVAKDVLGVVLEVALAGGLDLVAVYADRRARYLNHAGGGVVWERPDDSLDELVHSLLSAARDVVERIGPWEGPRPPAPRRGQARLSFLTPSGLHFGQGPFDELAADPLAGPVVQRATALMSALTSRV